MAGTTSRLAQTLQRMGSSSSSHDTPAAATAPQASVSPGGSSLQRRSSSRAAGESNGNAAAGASSAPAEKTRHKWTADETQALADGCNKHGVGCWTMILDDPEFSGRFVNRNAGDLKDRFRTYFSDAYHELVSAI